MCDAVAIPRHRLPLDLIERQSLRRRIHERGGEPELQFHYRDRNPRLPVQRDGRLQIVRWGNGRGQSRSLPRTGWTWLETVESGGWQEIGGLPVEIPATLVWDRGVWYAVRQGVRGLLVPDERGAAVVYVICEPASSYYRVMTRSNRMPVLIEERI
ncbi:MAG: hypothetical protein SFX72_19870 [Isosphaeraceae bacterium]|nr:hypothetical protein [Isosphaeraceae bacterium]